MGKNDKPFVRICMSCEDRVQELKLRTICDVSCLLYLGLKMILV